MGRILRLITKPSNNFYPTHIEFSILTLIFEAFQFLEYLLHVLSISCVLIFLSRMVRVIPRIIMNSQKEPLHDY